MTEISGPAASEPHRRTASAPGSVIRDRAGGQRRQGPADGRTGGRAHGRAGETGEAGEAGEAGGPASCARAPEGADRGSRAPVRRPDDAAGARGARQDGVMTSAISPTLALHDGHEIPQLGFGVYKTPPARTAEAVSVALAAGYRHIDTATLYANEQGVGEAVRASGLDRDEVFITTKVWNADQGYDATLAAFAESERLLGLGVVDLYLIHWPQPARGLFVDTYRALETLKGEGRVRSIGVSNFEPEHLEALREAGLETPVLNQVELHPRLQQEQVRAYGERHGILTEAWAPLGRGSVLDDPVLAGIAAEHGITPAQAVLRWHLQQGRIAIPKSVTPERIRENIDVFGFVLDEAQMAAIDALDAGEAGRTGKVPGEFND